MERFPNRESNCSVLCICWKITVCIRCLPEDTMAPKNPITLNAYYLNLYTDYLDFLNSTELSASTIGHYKGISRAFMDYLQQRKIGTIENITMDVCNSYLKTLAGYSFKTIEQNVCGIRHFLRFIYSIGILSTDYAEKIHMPAVSKSA